MREEPPGAEEVERALNRLEAHYVRQLESVGGFGGRADLLNYFNVFTGDPGASNTDFDRYRAVTPQDVQERRAELARRGPRATRRSGQWRRSAGLPFRRSDASSPAPARAARSARRRRRLRFSNGLDLLVVEKHRGANRRLRRVLSWRSRDGSPRLGLV